MGRPATGQTRARNVRVPDGLWAAAKAKATAEGRTITDVIVTALHRYITAPSPQQEPTDSED